jgi:PAS domain S-box-containing protein
MLSGHENITGVLEFLDQRASVEAALKLHSKTERIFVITDTSTTGNANRLLMQEIASEYRDAVEFVFLDRDNSGLTRQELLYRLGRLPEKSIVYYSDFLRNREGYIDQETMVPAVSRESKRPVYTHYDEILGLGVVGGKLVNGRSHGRKAAEIARQVIQGKLVSEIPVYRESINRHMFDHLQMKRFGIAESDLPEGSIVINKPVSFYESYKKAVWATAGVIAALLSLVAFLVSNIVRRKSAEDKLKKARDNLEQEVRERTDELSSSNEMLKDEISERKKVEAERASIYNAISDLITVQDTNYRILSYNKTVEDTFGKGLEGKLCYEAYQGRKEICPDCAVKKAIETKKLASTLQLSLNPPSAPSVEIYAYPIFDEKGEVTAVVEHGRDVSEKIEMVRNLKDSEEKYRMLVESAQEGIWTIDKDGRTTFVNPRMAEMLGYAADEMQGMHIFSFMDEKGVEIAKHYLERRKQGIKEQHDFELVRKDGARIYASLQTNPILDGNGEYFGALACVADITDRKRAEEQVRESEEKYQKLFNNEIDAICIFEVETRRIIDVNDAFIKSYGYSKEEALELSVDDVSAEPEVSQEVIKRSDETGNVFIPLRRNRKKDGTEFFVEISTGPFNWKGLRVMYAVIRDITDRKRAEEQVRESEERFRAAFENAAVGASMANLKGRFIKVNRFLCGMLGYSEEEFLSRTFSEVTHPDDVQIGLDAMKKMLSGEATYTSFEKRYLRKDGQLINVIISPALIRDGDGNPQYFVALFQDITDRKRAEGSLLLYQKHLEAIKEIATMAGATLDLEDVLQRILSGTLDASSAKVGMIFLKDHKTGCLKWGASIGLSEEFVNDYRNRLIQSGEGLTGRIYQTGEMIYIPVDSSHDPRIARPVVEAEGLNSFIGVAIQAGGEIVGVMNILSRPPDILSEDVIALVSAIGLQVGWAIRNAQLYEKLKKSLKEKEILLREIHHRVKNNMAIVSSLLQLQSQHVTDENLKKIFNESRNRIVSMALVHEKLYQSTDLAEIDLKEYVEALMNNLFVSYGIRKGSISLKADIDENVQLDIDRLIPCGLILNELVTNSLKHAFHDGKNGEIRVGFKTDDSNKVTVSVSDNGCGLPAGMDIGDSKTLGLNLITSLTRQLRGNLEYDGTDGMSVEITFKRS